MATLSVGEQVEILQGEQKGYVGNIINKCKTLLRSMWAS